MFPGVSMPVRFLNLTSFGGGGPSNEDRLGGGASRPSMSGSGGIVCVSRCCHDVSLCRSVNWSWRVELERVLG